MRPLRPSIHLCSTMSHSGGRLERSQRALSQAHLSSSFTPLSSNDLTSGRVRSSSVSVINVRSGDSKINSSAGVDWPFDSTFTARGFDAQTDPFAAFEPEVGEPALGGDGTARKADTSCDEWWERLGASASKFGCWVEGEGSRWGGRRASSAHDESDEGEEDQEEMVYIKARPKTTRRLRLDAHKPQIPLGVAVWHDRCEQSEDFASDYDYFRPSSTSTSPFSTPALSFSHLSTLGGSSNPSSPASTRSMALQSPPISGPHSEATRKVSFASETDLDHLTHSFLATQDRFGVFSMVERLLEWPWSSGDITPAFHSSDPNATILTPNPSLPTSAPLSRIASSHSLALDLSTPARLDEGAWTESGELSAYARARMAEMDSSKDSARSSAERRKAEGAGPVRETLGALLDSVGLRSFV